MDRRRQAPPGHQAPASLEISWCRGRRAAGRGAPCVRRVHAVRRAAAVAEDQGRAAEGRVQGDERHSARRHSPRAMWPRRSGCGEDRLRQDPRLRYPGRAFAANEFVPQSLCVGKATFLLSNLQLNCDQSFDF
jgi:hypothetical protein